MSHIEPYETLELRKRILTATSKGRLQDWNERIGEIAILANVEMGYINWCQTPALVASAVIEYVNQRNQIEIIHEAIMMYETQPQK